MTRQQQRKQRRERNKAEKIVKKFLGMYSKEINKANKSNKKSLSNIKKGYTRLIGLSGKPVSVEAKENHERTISEVNNIYMGAWRQVVDHCRKNFPLAGVDPNYFDKHVIWE